MIQKMVKQGILFLLCGIMIFYNPVCVWAKGSTEVPVARKSMLAAPTFRKADRVSDKKIEVDWNKVSGSDGYIIYRSSSKNGTYKKIKVITGASTIYYIDSGLKMDKNYYYKMRAYKVQNGKKISGEWSDIQEGERWKDSRLGYLFPNGVPKTESAMRKYLTTIRVPIRSAGGKKSSMSLTIHRKLANKVKACFKEMYDIGFPVRSSDTGSVCWRMMRTKPLRSHHSYGCVVDLNWNANPMIQNSMIGKCAYKPGKNRYSVTQKVVKIWESHGFYWGGNWAEKKDYMHFTYTNY